MRPILLLVCVLGLTVRTGMAQQPPSKVETVIQRGHVQPISCVAYAPDGSVVASGSEDHTIKLWDAQSGKEIRSLHGHTGSIRSIQFHPDGSTLLSAANDNRILVFDILTGAIRAEFPMPEHQELQMATFSPDGAKVMACSKRDENHIYDLTTGQLLTDTKKMFGVNIGPEWFDPTGERVIVAQDYRTAAIANSRTGEVQTQLPFSKTQTTSFSPDGKLVVLGSTKLFATVFDAQTGDSLFSVSDTETGCDGCNTQVRFSHDGKMLVTGTSNSGLTLWNTANVKKLRRLMYCEDRVSFLEFSPDDKLLLARFDDEVILFETATGKERFKLKSDLFEYFRPAFSPDSRFLLLPTERFTCALISTSSGKEARRFQGFLNHEKNDGMSFSHSNWTHASIIRFLSAKSGFAISPDGKTLALGKVDSSALLIDRFTGRTVKTLQGHSKEVWDLEFSPDGKLLATCGGDRDILIWDVATGSLVSRLQGHRDLIFDMAFSSDGKQLVSGSWDGTIRNWDVATGRDILTIDKQNTSAYQVGFTPNDLYIVLGDLDKRFELWEVDSGEPFRAFIGHRDVTASFCFTQGSRQELLSASWDGSLKRWDLLTGMLLDKAQHENGTANVVAHSPALGLIASGGSDRTLYLWDEKLELKTQLTGHSTQISALHFTADGHLFSQSVDGVLICWDLSGESPVEKFTYIRMGRSDWLAKNPAGRFDGTQDALHNINYVSGMEVVEVGALFEKLYTPGLIRQISQNKELNTSGSLDRMIRNGASVSLSRLASDPGQAINERTVSLEAEYLGEGNPEEVRVYNNGKLVLSEEWREKIVFRGGGDSKVFELELVDGKNEITCVVITQDRLENRSSALSIDYDGEHAGTDLFILSIGINDYQNDKYDLNYAVGDAKAFAKEVKNGSDSLFKEVSLVSLTDKQATKQNIISAVNDLKGKVGPEDVFVFYFAGHGVMSGDGGENEEFHLVLHDVTQLYGDAKMMSERGLSAKELMDIAKDIKGQKQLFVLDACHSGGALQTLAQRGSSREKALAQLAHSTGTYFLTAAQEFEYANESGGLKHGLFTYAILEALVGKADGGRLDRKITVGELKSYVEDRVPELSQEQHGSAQYPTSFSFGQDFPIVLIR